MNSEARTDTAEVGTEWLDKMIETMRLAGVPELCEEPEPPTADELWLKRLER